MNLCTAVGQESKLLDKACLCYESRGVRTKYKTERRGRSLRCTLYQPRVVLHNSSKSHAVLQGGYKLIATNNFSAEEIIASFISRSQVSVCIEWVG